MAGKSLKQIMNDKCTKFGRPDVITVEGDKGILLPNGLHVKYPNLRTVTDELGDTAVQNKVHMHDLHATILHILGLDHEKLTYRYAGRDFRLTDVHGSVVRDILS